MCIFASENFSLKYFKQHFKILSAKINTRPQKKKIFLASDSIALTLLNDNVMNILGFFYRAVDINKNNNKISKLSYTPPQKQVALNVQSHDFDYTCQTNESS